MFGANAVSFLAADLKTLFESLKKIGRRVIGPTLKDGGVKLDELQTLEELPIGYRDEQGPGHYQLSSSSREAYFDCTLPMESWRIYLCPSGQLIWSARKANDIWRISPTSEDKPLAFFGVRGCDLHGILMQKKIWKKQLGDHGWGEDPFIISIDCHRVVATCFCASMGTGPSAYAPGVDLRLAEILSETKRHEFIAEAYTERGETLLKSIVTMPCSEKLLREHKDILENVKRQQARFLPLSEIEKIFSEKEEDTRWDQFETRCLACSNCTFVCPSCFCFRMEDRLDLDEQSSQQMLVWDSCFHESFSYMHGGSIRKSIRSRYRQWLLHKLYFWEKQFGESGCVGCGRCITWCPVGIDITKTVEDFQK